MKVLKHTKNYDKEPPYNIVGNEIILSVDPANTLDNAVYSLICANEFYNGYLDENKPFLIMEHYQLLGRLEYANDQINKILKEIRAKAKDELNFKDENI